MINLTPGRIKTYILSGLIITSLILCGSLWLEDYHGFSNFIAKIRTLNLFRIIGAEDTQSKHEKLIQPSKVIVNDGEEGHWVLNPTNSLHSRMWALAKGMLKDIVVKGDEIKGTQVPLEEWNSLMTKNSVIVLFDYPLRKELLSIAYKTKEKEIYNAMEGVDSIGFMKLGESIVVYTKTGNDQKIDCKKYTFSGMQGITDEDFKQVYNDFSLIKYALPKEVLPNVALDLSFKEEVFLPIFSFSDTRRKEVKFKKVEFEPEITTTDQKQVDEYVQKFFAGLEYSKFIKEDGTHICIDEKNNTVKVYPEGLIEYEAKDQESVENMGFKEAFDVALNTAEKFGDLDNLFLSAYLVKKQEWSFSFNYAVEGSVIKHKQVNNLPYIDNSIEIIVRDGYINYRRFYQKHEIKEREYNFSSDHDSILNAVFEKAGSNKAKIQINSVELVYIPSVPSNKPVLPVWQVKFDTNGKGMVILVEAGKDRR